MPSRRRLLATALAVTPATLAGCGSLASNRSTRGTRTRSTTTRSRTDRQDVARTFLDRWLDESYTAARELLAPVSRGSYTVSALRTSRLGLHAAAGDPTGVESVAVDGEWVRATVACQTGPVSLRVQVGDDGAVRQFAVGGRYEPPDYADRGAFTERPVEVPATDCTLPGTLSVPTGAGPFPAVVLVHGTGPLDRNATVLANQPFRDLAWGLASRGIAVLRYDKRTATCSVPPADHTIDRVTVEDAVAALQTLRGRYETLAAGTFVVGHSVGATCAPRIADRDGGLAGVAMLAGNARPITTVVREQYEHLFRVDGQYTAAERERFEAVDDALFRAEACDLGPRETVAGLPGAWYESVLAYDQRATAAALEIPRWLAFGGRDYQVPAAPATSAWREALGGDPAATIRTFDDLSHLFQPGFEPSLGAEYRVPDTVDEAVIDALAEWIERTPRG